MAEKVVAKLELEAADLGGTLGRVAGPRGQGLAGGASEMAKKNSKNTQVIAGAIVAGQAIWEGIKKGVQALVKASPALQQTLLIFKSSMTLLLKPIGDLFSMILRPFALAFLRWAIPFYKESMKNIRTTGGKVGGVVGGIAGGALGIAAGGGAAGLIGGLAALGTLAGPIGTAVGVALGVIITGLGILVGINFGAEIEEWIDSIKTFFAEVDWGEFFMGMVEFFTTTLPGLVGEGLSKLGDAFIALYTEVIPFAMGYMYESILIFFTETFPKMWQKFKETVMKVFVAIGLYIGSIPGRIKEGWIAFVDYIKLIPEKVIQAFDKIKEFFTKTIPNWFMTLGKKILDMIDRIKGAFTLGRSTRRTRSAGDFVVTPQGDFIKTDPRDYIMAMTDPSKMLGGGEGLTYSPTINVNAQISSEIDIQRLAEKLADYSKDELSRRTTDFRI